MKFTLRHVLPVCFLLLSASVGAATAWVPVAGGPWPPGAVIGGTEAGRPLAVCRIVSGSEHLIGKADGDKCLAGLSAREMSSAKFEILTSQPPTELAWGNDEKAFRAAVAGGQFGGQPASICRVNWEPGTVLIGRLFRDGSCRYAYRGAEAAQPFPQFEILFDVAAAAPAMAAAASAAAVARQHLLYAGETLKSGQFIVSPNKRAFAIMQGDGNFVVYRGSGPKDGQGALFHTKTGGRPAGAYLAAMQEDGNFVIWNNGQPLYDTKTWGTGKGVYFLQLNDDGSLSLRKGPAGNPASSVEFWNSASGLTAAFKDAKVKAGAGAQATAAAKAQAEAAAATARAQAAAAQAKAAAAQAAANAAMAKAQADAQAAQAAQAQAAALAAGPFVTGGNILRTGKFLRTGQYMVSASGKHFAIMQSDGNFCHYMGSGPQNRGPEHWCSGTHGIGIAYAQMQSDGNFCVRKGADPQHADPSYQWCTRGTSAGTGEYFALIQDDSNFVIYRGREPGPAAESIWNRLSAAEEARNGWDKFKNAVTGAWNVVASGVSDVAGSVARGTVGAAQATANVAVQTANNSAALANAAVAEANRAAAEAEQAARAAADATARLSVNTANTVATGTVNTANTVAGTTVQIGNQIVDTSSMVGATVGREVVKNGKVVGKEIVKNGQVVGRAVVDVAEQAWALVKGNCAEIGRKVMPTNAFEPMVQTLDRYGNSQMKTGTQCYRDAEVAFLCEFPAELERLVSDTGDMTRNLPALAQRVWSEMGSQECLYTIALTTIIPPAPALCGLGKILVADARKAYACASIAHSSGLLRKYLPSGSQAASFPSRESCQAIGGIAFQAAETVATQGLGKEAQAALKAGKGMTAVVVAEKLRKFYGALGAASSFEQLTAELQALPACQ